jgi:protein-S-isoprenylcysteine O-methyltransferase
LAGEWLWFADNWAETVFVALIAGMWLAATAFVDVDVPRGPRDRTDSLIPLALLLTVPVSVLDRLYGPAARVPAILGVIGVIVCVAAIALGLSARSSLGRAYRPRATVQPGVQLVRSGPYRWIRHPMYAAALLWAIGWPLIIGSLLGAAVTLLILLPALLRRIGREETDLRRVFGEEYVAYSTQTRRLLPFIY